MQLGFVIDHSRCIGCHACTVACKSENDVPLGSFRTWVKYTETGTFPQVRRSFAVLRCNQCSNAPCVTICPVAALEKRSDGIVDIDPDVCVGCKACMQACPYDALYIHEGTGTAQKCHFCAHRTDRGLAPACAVVCPTEAIIPGDFADPSSRVARMKQEGDLTARKTEAGTGPNVWYREADPAGLDPARTNAAGGYLWANAVPGARLDADTFEAMEQQAGSRTTYDVAHEPLWGGKVSGYLFTKSIAAGLFLAISAFLPPHERGSLGLGLTATGLGAALLALLVTTALLVADLKRPERFLKILFHANWSSWLARGSIVLMAYGGILSLWFLLVLIGRPPAGALAWGLNLLGFFLAVFAAVYTAFLFRQAKGRVLWLSPVLGVELIAHAVLAGFASLLLLAPFFDVSAERWADLRLYTLYFLGVNALVLVARHFFFEPRGREAEYRRAHRLVTHGPYARKHWVGAVLVGLLLPTLILALPVPLLWSLAGLPALLGLFIAQDVLVRAGQALPIS